MRQLALIACCKRKLDHPAPAGQLYTSPLFQSSLAYARYVLCLPDSEIFVLSAKYGLVPITREIAPYDWTLSAMRVSARRRWAGNIFTALWQARPLGEYLVSIMAGRLYSEPLAAILAEAGGRRVNLPAGRMGLARRIQWYRSRLPDVRPFPDLVDGRRIELLTDAAARRAGVWTPERVYHFLGGWGIDVDEIKADMLAAAIDYLDGQGKTVEARSFYAIASQGEPR